VSLLRPKKLRASAIRFLIVCAVCLVGHSVLAGSVIAAESAKAPAAQGDHPQPLTAGDPAILTPPIAAPPSNEIVEKPFPLTEETTRFPAAIDTSPFERLRFEGVPSRIVSLTPGVTETLFALGVGPRVVGVSQYCDHPDEVSSLPRVGSFLSPVVEAVIKLEPDLVITSPSPGNRNAVEAIERAGVRVEVVGEGSASIDEIRDTIRRVSKLVGRSLEGELLLDRINSAVSSVRNRVSELKKPTVAVVIGYEPLVLAGPQSYLGDLVGVAGGRNIADEVGGKWPRTGWEFLLAADPEVIIDASMEEADQAKVATISRRWAQYPSIKAVSDGRVFGHGGFLLLRPGPRVAEQALLMGRYLHPK
jgi:iron complex transport system substrate-binding protein